MKKFLGILVLGLGLVFSTPSFAASSLTDKDLENMDTSKSRFEGLIDFFKESSENKIPIDPDAAALEFGYKSFEEFAKEYFRVMETPKSLKVNDVREFLKGADETVIIDQSDENLDKLLSLIMKDKVYKKRQTYTKFFKKGKSRKGDKIEQMALAVYLNYEKEMAKITKNPDLKKISPLTWGWGMSWGSSQYQPYGWAFKECKKDVKKHKMFGGECIIVDWRSPITGEIKNMLKPSERDTVPGAHRIKDSLLSTIERIAARNEKLRKEKLKPKKEKKKEVAKATDQTEKAKSTIDLTIPVQVYIVQVNKKEYKTTTTPEDVKNDFKVVNSLWNNQGIQFELIDIVKSEGNTKSLKKDIKWVKEKYLKSLAIDSKEGKVKSDEPKRITYWKMMHKLIKGTTNRNENAINLFYVPYLPGHFMCGVAYSYSTVIDSSFDQYKRQNAGYAIIGEQSTCESGKTTAHEIGHMFSLGHKETTNVDLMMWGDGERINSWQADKLRKYHNKYLNKTLALN